MIQAVKIFIGKKQNAVEELLWMSTKQDAAGKL